jgi:hypothetical protein
MAMPHETIENVDFELLIGGEVTGAVRRRDGKPLTHRYRVLLDTGRMRAHSAYANADGSFTIENVYPGTYDVELYRRDENGLQLLATHEGIMVPEGLTTGDIEFVVDE